MTFWLRRLWRRLRGRCTCRWCECPALPYGDTINRCDECATHALRKAPPSL